MGMQEKANRIEEHGPTCPVSLTSSPPFSPTVSQRHDTTRPRASPRPTSINTDTSTSIIIIDIVIVTLSLVSRGNLQTTRVSCDPDLNPFLPSTHLPVTFLHLSGSLATPSVHSCCLVPESYLRRPFLLSVIYDASEYKGVLSLPWHQPSRRPPIHRKQLATILIQSSIRLADSDPFAQIKGLLLASPDTS
ncbi:hypothetical protein FJTKL_05775 [Diaporthe vaccinii]|uniref:Uncharacterized protein n=1 Tax=Diaporthe vaccinii TaxID=105482 RepID=A0ABR4EYA9_9PEZI